MDSLVPIYKVQSANISIKGAVQGQNKIPGTISIC
jgi:hypothetical protein